MKKYKKERLTQESLLASVRKKIKELETKTLSFQEQIKELSSKASVTEETISQLDSRRDAEVGSLLEELGVQLSLPFATSESKKTSSEPKTGDSKKAVGDSKKSNSDATKTSGDSKPAEKQATRTNVFSGFEQLAESEAGDDK